MNTHQDALAKLNTSSSIAEKLKILHQSVQQQHPYISRIAIALYDTQTDLLKTFVYSSEETSPLCQYEALLSDCGSLTEIKNQAQPRVVHDLEAFRPLNQQHTLALLEAGYRSSYTLPMVMNDHFFGFVFFNAKEPARFQGASLVSLDMVAHMITLLVYNERSNIRTLVATIKSALDMTHSRDPETAYHLERMSRYTRLIARHLAPRLNFDDSYIEHIYLFAPLHDLGKIKTPDRILLKPSRLTDDEFQVMQNHPTDGKELIDALLENYGLNGVSHVQMLRNIANYHHEMLDGTGYPEGLIGCDIPIEARIVAVADIFDALTSRRPYKEAWTNEEAMNKLTELSSSKLDPDCVQALIENIGEVERIQQNFAENSYG